MAKQDHYRVLGVARSADSQIIRRAFRRLAKRYHPDVGTGDVTRFREISEAYQILSDPRRRAEYDKTLPSTRRTQPSPSVSPQQPPPRPVTSQPKPATASEYITAIAAVIITLLCVGLTYGVSELGSFFQGGAVQLQEEHGRDLMRTTIAEQTATAISYPTTTPASNLKQQVLSAQLTRDAIMSELRDLAGAQCVVDLVQHRHTCATVPQVRVTAGPYENAVALQIDLDPRHYDLTRVVFRVIYADRRPQGLTVNIGDSPSNEGQGGDNGDQEHDAELAVDGTSLVIYGSDDIGQLSRVDNFAAAGATVFIEVGDQLIRWIGVSRAEMLESRHLYALGGQADRRGRDYRIYAGFNRPARLGRTQFGAGVERVEIYLLNQPA